MTDDLVTLRRLAALEDALDRLAEPGAGGVAVVGVTVNLGAYPTAARAYYAVNPGTLAGAEAEGGAAPLAASGPALFALNLGTGVPPVGTQVLVSHVPDRWVMRWDG